MLLGLPSGNHVFHGRAGGQMGHVWREGAVLGRCMGSSLSSLTGIQVKGDGVEP